MLLQKILSPFILILITLNALGQSTVSKSKIEIGIFGNIFVSTKIRKLNTKKDTIISGSKSLIHKDQADLLRGVKLNYMFNLEYKAKTNKLSYINRTKANQNQVYIKNKNLLLLSSNYLVYKKSDALKKKKFDLDIKIPAKYHLIYPLKSDLEKGYRFSPPIIAGNFNNKEINGFEVYYLNKQTENAIKMDSIVEVIEDSYLFYSNIYPKLDSKPKLFFIPFKSKRLLGLTMGDIILLNSCMLDSGYVISKRLIAHEVAHLWWGTRGLTFKNKLITEAIAEYMATEYLKEQKETKFLKTFINQKHYHCEGITDKSELYTKKRTKQTMLYSYEFTPLLFEQIQNKSPNLMSKLAEFYKINSLKLFVTTDNLESFLKENKMRKFIDDYKLPDYFITETKDSIIINGITDTIENVNIELIDIKDNKSNLIVEFSREKQSHSIEKKSIKKITIDPNFKTLQQTRLNDIWTKGDSSLLNKNRYFSVETTNDTVVRYASDVLNYLLNKDSNEFLHTICKSNIKFIEKAKELKSIINNSKYLPTGASVYYRKANDEIDVKLAYYSIQEKKTKVIYVKLFVYDGLKYLRFLNYKIPQ